MDGENHGKPYESMDDLGGKPTMEGKTQIEKKSATSQALQSTPPDGVEHLHTIHKSFRANCHGDGH